MKAQPCTRVNNQTTVALGGSQFELRYDIEGDVAFVSDVERLAIQDIRNLPYQSLEREIELDNYRPLDDVELGLLEEYNVLFDSVDIQETSRLLDYLGENEGENLFEGVQENFNFNRQSFDVEATEFF